MNFDGNVKEIGTIKNVAVFKKLINMFNDYDWNSDPCAYENVLHPTLGIDPAFKDCRVIQFNISSLMLHIRNNIICDYSLETNKIINITNIIVAEILSLFPDHYHLKSHYVAIEPHGCQTKHTDDGYYHGLARRICVPIITSDHALSHFRSNDVHKLKAGTIYETNNRVPHYSNNNDDTYRVFLFLDLIPSENIMTVKNFYIFND